MEHDRLRGIPKSFLRVITITRFEFEPDGVPVHLHRGLEGVAGPGKGVEHGIADEGEHPDQPPGDLRREGSRVGTLDFPGDVGPDLAEPQGMVVAVDHAKVTLVLCRVAVPSGFPEEKDVLEVVLDDPVRLERLTQECRTVAGDLGGHVRDLAPDDRCKRVEPYLLALDLDVRMQGFYQVTTVTLT